MSTTEPTSAPTAQIFKGLSAAEFLTFDRQVARWLRRKYKGLTKHFWTGYTPDITDENAKELCVAIYTSLLKTKPFLRQIVLGEGG